MYAEGTGKGFMLRTIISPFLRLSIANKMLLGYFAVSVVTIIIAVYVLSSLERINRINNSIVNKTVPLMNTAERMEDTLLSQELYGRRYVILKSPEMLDLFLKKNEEFDLQVKEIERMLPKDLSVELLASGHIEYKNLFVEGFKHLEDPSLLAKKYDRAIKKKQKELLELIEKISIGARRDQNEKTLMITSIGTIAFRTAIVLCVLGILLGIGTAMLITRNIAGSINKLKLATKQISEGSFDNLPRVRNQDELGDLSISFGEMARRLKRLEEMYLDASPLTRLPGGVSIESVLKKRLDADLPIAFCLLDMDNFKAFNDRYGYARGNEIIKGTARIIEEAVSQYGTEEDFVGHIGGDDFVIISTPDRYSRICSAIIEIFDRVVPDFYDMEDRQKGYIAGKTRQGEEMTFPFMTISIAVVTNQTRKFSNYIQIGELSAELKEYAKSIPGSVYVVDQRRRISED